MACRCVSPPPPPVSAPAGVVSAPSGTVELGGSFFWRSMQTTFLLWFGAGAGVATHFHALLVLLEGETGGSPDDRYNATVTMCVFMRRARATPASREHPALLPFVVPSHSWVLPWLRAGPGAAHRPPRRLACPRWSGQAAAPSLVLSQPLHCPRTCSDRMRSLPRGCGVYVAAASSGVARRTWQDTPHASTTHSPGHVQRPAGPNLFGGATRPRRVISEGPASCAWRRLRLAFQAHDPPHLDLPCPPSQLTRFVTESDLSFCADGAVSPQNLTSRQISIVFCVLFRRDPVARPPARPSFPASARALAATSTSSLPQQFWCLPSQGFNELLFAYVPVNPVTTPCAHALCPLCLFSYVCSPCCLSYPPPLV